MADPHLVPVDEHGAQRAKFTKDLVCDHEEVVGFQHVVHTGRRPDYGARVVCGTHVAFSSWTAPAGCAELP